MTFNALSASSKDVTVKVYGEYSNGKKTNEASTVIQLRNALTGLNLSSNKSSLYTGESATLTISAANSNVYGWGDSAEVTLSATAGTASKTSGKLTGTFTAPASLTSASSQSVTITATAAANKYSTAAKTKTATVTVKQAATGITTGTVPTIYAGDGANTFTYTLAPTNCYEKGVTVTSDSAVTTYFSASAAGGKITITPKAAGTGNITLKSADNKISKTVSITITAKGGSSISVSSTPKTLNPSQVDISFTVSSTGCTLSAPTTSNAAIATATISGGKLNITAGTTTGTATITISGTASTGYTAPASKTVSVTVKNISISVV